MKYALIAALVLALTPKAAADTPIRVLVYRFADDSRSGVHGGIDYMAGTLSASGTITASIANATPDGGLVVDLVERIDRLDKPVETIRCAVYGRTQDVVCDQNLVPTHAELALAAFLGRFFYEPDRVDGNEHWRTVPSITRAGSAGSHVEVTNDYRITKRDGDDLTIAVTRRERGAGYVSETQGSLRYDASLSVPKALKIEVASQTGGALADMNLSLTLESDSLSPSVGKANP